MRTPSARSLGKESGRVDAFKPVEGGSCPAAVRGAELARALLAARGIEVSPEFPGVPGFAELPGHAIVEAAASNGNHARPRGALV